MTDPRPRPLPEYGEYATPEEQARAMGLPAVPAPPLASSQLDAPQRAEATVVRSGPVNRFFTIMLLVIGGLALFNDVPSFLNFGPAFISTLKTMGETGITAPASLARAGIWLLLTNIVLYLATVLWSVSALRAGRSSAFIPIVGFIAFVLATSIIISIASPGLIAQLHS